MYPFIVGDIGGTNARLGLVEDFNCKDQTFTINHVQVLPCADYSNLDTCLEAYLKTIPKPELVHSACIAIAGPISGDVVAMTNLNWRFSITQLRQHFGWHSLKILNDFAAQACALPYLSAGDLVEIKSGCAVDNAVKAVIGPGTGLGVALLSPVEGIWYPLSGEGGHVAVAPGNALEIEIVRVLLQQFSYVSIEMVLSGPGLVNLYRAICAINGNAAQDISAAHISELGASNKDSNCQATLSVFCSILGNSAGNLALTSGARGGVYLAGGILPRMIDFLQHSAFNQQFANKGCMSHFVESIPVQLVTATQPALIGAAAWQLNHGK